MDVLITAEGLRQFREHWLGRGYVEARRGAKSVRDTETRVKIDFLIAGEFPGDSRPKPVQFPDPKERVEWIEGTPVLPLPSLIELKLASGMTTKDRPRDFDDVIRLIRVRGLPQNLSDHLNPFVRSKFDELWEAAQLPSDDY